MALFAKNKPTKKVEFDGGYVELQHLSKGVKDEIASRLAALYKGMDRATLEKMKDTDDLPDNMIDAVSVVQEVEYYKLSHAIKSWSESEIKITIETVKDLDEEVFNKISKAVNEMNELNKQAEKN
ncbi:MAG: hypothetical protein K0S80_4410 [Neobacillus sp.]|nr:hypothetical protein [Neobacillus sp.]